MLVSKVYFMNDRAYRLAESITFKAVKLMCDAGLKNLFKKGDIVGIKVQIGEYGNSLNIRPQWVRAIVEEVQKLGGKPVLVDCTSIVNSDFSSCATRDDYLRAASRHGFTEETMGCPIYIADGDYGFDDVQVPVPNGVFLKHAFIGKKLLELDACIVVSHFTGDRMGVYSGAIQNVGLGMGSKRGKMTALFLNHPVYGIINSGWSQDVAQKVARPIDNSEVTIMDRLIKCCPFDALEWKDEKFDFNKDTCTNCGVCFFEAFTNGIHKLNPEIFAIWPSTIADSAAAYINAIGKNKFLYVNYAMDITPYGDTTAFQDKQMIPNLGVYVSNDPVAVDLACLDAAEDSVCMPGSRAEELGLSKPNTERFTYCSSSTKESQWSQANAAVFNGLGSDEYILVKSVPGREENYWFPPYTPNNTFCAVNKAGLAFGIYDPGEYYQQQPKLSIIELSARPKGKIKEISIFDEE